MTKAQVQDDIFRRLDKIEKRLNIVEGGPQHDVTYASAVRASTLGTAHVSSTTPIGGRSGDMYIGTSKIWVNDNGTWKSVAVA